MNVPCYGCERREIGCHSSCDDYTIFTAEKERKKEAEYKTNLARGLATAYSRERYHRLSGRKD